MGQHGKRERSGVAPVRAGMRKNIAFLVFDEVRAVDFTGPLEVFALADQLGQRAWFHVFVAALTPGTVRTHGGLKLVPDFTLENCPSPQIIIIPGGRGVAALLNRFGLHEWLRRQTRRAEIILTVGDGALVLTAAGLLDDAGQASGDATEYGSGNRIITTPGFSAAMATSLQLVSRLAGPELAARTAAHLEGGPGGVTGG